jgi:A-macroglobulin TED domain/Carboxypeptidase regulatory-like domain/Alpha-2-macroglobulin family/MG2 domain/A-macroglobulin receptor binding domain/Alpha-2-macroglobulin bait region domain
MNKTSKSFFVLAALMVIAAALLLPSLENAQAAPGETLAATYSSGALHVTIPFHGLHTGAGQLTVEVLDPEDVVLGRSERRVETEGAGTWREEIPLAKPPSLDDIVWHRVRYRFHYADQQDAAIQGTESISEILRTPVVHILGQQSYLTGGQAAVRVIVTDSKNAVIAGPGSVRIDLMAPGARPRVLFAGRLNQRGTTEAQFRFPAGVAGSFPMRYVVDTPIGSTELTQQVRLEAQASMLLTTEKPIYQPGQTIHVRALALDRASHEATANRKLTLEVEDSRGNKVFKKVTQTDTYGVASAEFALADEVNLGTYHLRALMDSNTAEIALNVERYVLPKFKVAVEFTGKDNHAKRGYRPGDHVTGTVRANYFFGKPVDGAEISVKGSVMDVAMVDAGSALGKTDGDGVYRFDLALPAYFAGLPLNHGTARVLIEATVKDSAGHAETRGEPVTVSESPLILTAIPEGGTLIPNLENQIFLLASYPDGTPAAATLKIHTAGNTDQSTVTDQGGVAVIRMHVGQASRPVPLQVEAADAQGNHASTTVPLELRQGEDQILLRTERAVYRTGDRILLKVFSTKARGTAYIDVVKNGQTVLTRDLDLTNGTAELTLPVTPDLAGTVDFSAYLFGRDARPVGDHRLVFVQPADELKIEAAADAAVYKPGDEARIRFRVTNSKGEGVQAALGLQIVDEAVFALAEKRPGFAKVFFYLEQQVLKPRYEIHSIGMPDIVEPVEAAKREQRDRAARALFAATEIVSGNKFETEAGRTIPQTKWAAYTTRYQARFQARVRQMTEDLNRVYQQNRSAGDLAKIAAKTDLRDSWDTGLRVERLDGDPQHRYYQVRSAGPDKRFDTADDLSTLLEVRTRKIAGPPTSDQMKIDLQVEHDRGPFNGRAEVAGTVKDVAGAAVPGATITLMESATGATRTATTNAAGQFTLAGLSAGDYQIRVSSPGFEIAARTLTLQVRDRAVLSAVLSVGAVTEAVVVEQFAAGRITVGGNVGMMRGIAGGVPGGVIGGIIGAVASVSPRQFDAGALRAPMVKEMALMDRRDFNTATLAKKESVGAAAPHVRSYFPEALYINPEIVTDRDGRASIVVPIADNITTWRMAMLASTTHGALGSGTGSLKVFQDFFVDLDLPVTLTQGDRVSIPVAAYNYSGAAGNVSLQLQADDWFTLVEDVPAKTLAVESGRVGGSQFTLEAKRIGKFKLTLSASLSGGVKRADIVVREIEVVPNGREQNLVFNGRLESTVRHDVTFPPTSIPDAGKIFVRLYPGPLSQVIEGMDSILRMPGGCFEQTSSSTYPNVLALDYMKRMKKLTPEVHAKAEAYIANGYQRLVTFEVPGGGFSWFGNPPANKILTAYGLMEFSDMSKVYDVDPKVIQRTQQWLAGQQQADGSWKPDTSFINEGATNRFNSDVLRITAYIAWSLESTGYQGPVVEKARQFVERQMGAKMDTYTLAVVANFAADYAKDREFTARAMQLLLDARTEKDEQAWWTAEETGVYGRGTSASVETTGLAAQALLKWGGASTTTTTKALNYVASKKDASGTWGTTQATIMALRAILLSTSKGAADVRGTVEITLNGKPVETLTLTADNNDLLHQFALKNVDSNGPNVVELRFTGKGSLAYQVVRRNFVPWDEKPAHEPLSISVNYDRTRLAQDDIATATATVKNNLTKVANMVMVDLGIPPGFDLLSEDLQAFQEKTAGRKGGRLEKFSLTATQAILYFDSIGAGDTITLHFRMRAKYPIRARTFQSRVYEYYDPEVNAVARPIQLEVRKK